MNYIITGKKGTFLISYIVIYVCNYITNNYFIYFLCELYSMQRVKRNKHQNILIIHRKNVVELLLKFQVFKLKINGLKNKNYKLLLLLFRKFNFNISLTNGRGWLKLNKSSILPFLVFISSTFWNTWGRSEFSISDRDWKNKENFK